MDLLICDNNYELHGNLRPIVGERYSVVAFLHKSLCYRTPPDDGWDDMFAPESGDLMQSSY